MLIFKESYFKSGKASQLIKSFKSNIQWKCAEIDKIKLDVSNINSSGFLVKDSKEALNYWQEIGKFNGKMAIHSYIDKQEYERAKTKSDELLRGYMLMYNKLDSLILDTNLDKIYSSSATTTSFIKIYDQYSEILAQSILTKNHYITTKCIIYLSKTYLEVGQIKFANELAEYALKQYKQCRIECTHLLYLILEVITRSNDTNASIYKSVQSSYIDQLTKEISKSGYSKLDFISKSGEINIVGMMNYFQSASLALNHCRYLTSPSMLYLNIENCNKIIRIFEGLQQANEQLSHSEKYIPYSGTYKTNLSLAYYYKACFMLVGQREAVSPKLYETAFHYSKSFENEYMKLSINKFAFSVSLKDVDSADKELNLIREMNVQKYPINHLSLLIQEIKYLIMIPKEDNKKLNKIIEKYSEFIKHHEQYLGQPFSQLVYNINNELVNAGLKSVVNTQNKKQVN